MVAQIGRQTIFRIGGTTSEFVIPGVREISIEFSGEPINVTSNEDAGVQTLLTDVVAERMVNLSISGIDKSTAIKDIWTAGSTSVLVSIDYPDGRRLSGTFNMTSFSEGHPYNDASTFEASLTSNGAVTYATIV